MLLFVFTHELGHLNQDRKKLSELMNKCISEEDKNMISQVKEMGADCYVVNRLLSHFFNTFHDKRNRDNIECAFFYKNEMHLVRYGVVNNPYYVLYVFT
jgi:hypothetical protein